MEKIDWKITIRRNILLLQSVGLWPPGDENYKLNLYTIYALFTIVSFIYGHNFFQTVNIFISPNLEAIAGTFFVTLSEMLTVVKSYYLMQNMDLLKQLMVEINRDIFQPKNKKQVEMIQPGINFWKTTSTVLWSMSSGAVFFWATYPILDGSVKKRRLPFLAWYPYDTTVSPMYEVTYIYQILSTAIIASSTLSIDTLIAALNVFVGAQCDILCDNLRQLFDEKDLNTDGKKLIRCIRHHKEILRFSENVNKFYNWIVLVQFFISAASIGIIMFQIPPFTSEFFSLVTFGIAVITQIFMYCWFGNEVEVKSNKIPLAIFESEWNGATIGIQKNIIFFITRTQKPLKMSALNLFYLSLETFVRILRTSYSYFAILQQASSRN